MKRKEEERKEFCLLGRIQKKKRKKNPKKKIKKTLKKKKIFGTHTHTHTHKRYCARRSVVVVVVHEKQNAMMSRHYYRHARISPPLFFFFFLATCVAFVAFAIDRSDAIRVPDFTTGIKSKFSVMMNESVKMMNPKNRRAKELEEEKR